MMSEFMKRINITYKHIYNRLINVGAMKSKFSINLQIIASCFLQFNRKNSKKQLEIKSTTVD